MGGLRLRTLMLLYLTASVALGSFYIYKVSTRSGSLRLVDFTVFLTAGRVVFEKDRSIYDFSKESARNFKKRFPLLPEHGFKMHLRNSVLNHVGADLNLFLPGYVLPYLYPPLLAYLMQPFTPLSDIGANWSWIVFNLLLAIALPFLGFLLLGRFHRGMDKRAMFATAAVCTAIFPWVLQDNLYWGQINIVVVVLLLLALWLHEDSPYLGGFCFAAAVLIKMSPALLGFYFLYHRNWRFLFAAAISCLAIVGVTLVLGGWDHWWKFLEVLPKISEGPRMMRGTLPADLVPNHSLKGFFYRISYFDSRADLFAMGVSIMLLAYALFRAYRLPPDEGRSALLLRLGCLMMLASPMAWHHHFVFLLPGVILFVFAPRGKPISPLRRGILLLLFLPALVPFYQWAGRLAVTESWRLNGLLVSWQSLLLLLAFFLPDLDRAVAGFFEGRNRHASPARA